MNYDEIAAELREEIEEAAYKWAAGDSHPNYDADLKALRSKLDALIAFERARAAVDTLTELLSWQTGANSKCANRAKQRIQQRTNELRELAAIALADRSARSEGDEG